MRDSHIALGALVLLAILGRTRRVVSWGKGWHWPVPDLDIGDGTGYPAVVSQEFGGSHAGVDIDYRRRNVMDRAEYRPTTEDGTTSYFAPPGTPVLAARDGRVWSVNRSKRGWEVVIDHGKPFATYYQHLQEVQVRAHADVKAGDRIGTMGSDPTDPQKFRHLHFAVWYQGSGDGASVDPEPEMALWTRSKWKKA